MKIAKVSHWTSARTEANRWSPQDDLILSLLVGQGFTYTQIALRLGRSAGAVQRRASNKGLSLNAEKAQDRATLRRLREQYEAQRLSTPVEALEEFCAVPDSESESEPVAPHVGSRTYHREYYRTKRSKKALQSTAQG